VFAPVRRTEKPLLDRKGTSANSLQPVRLCSRQWNRCAGKVVPRQQPAGLCYSQSSPRARHPHSADADSPSVGLCLTPVSSRLLAAPGRSRHSCGKMAAGAGSSSGLVADLARAGITLVDCRALTAGLRYARTCSVGIIAVVSARWCRRSSGLLGHFLRPHLATPSSRPSVLAFVTGGDLLPTWRAPGGGGPAEHSRGYFRR
jgi:hypothetical protein